MPDPITLVPTARKASEGVKAKLVLAVDLADREGVIGIAIAMVNADGSTATIYEPGENIATLIGSVQRLTLRLLEH